MQRIVIIGAGSTIAEHCARLWVRVPVEMILVGRDAKRLEPIAADLRVRSPASRITILQGDLLQAESVQQLMAAITAGGVIDLALIAQGMAEGEALETVLQVNAMSPVLWMEAFAAVMAQQGHGTLGVIGSVAGDRARRSNYRYGAAKAMLHAYAEGLQHRFAATGVKVVLIKPGPTATRMTAALEMRIATAEVVAVRIVRGMAKGARVVYAPGYWRWVMLGVRALPWVVFRRLDI